MIQTPEQVYHAIDQMGRMQRILESYRNEILNENPRNFAMLAEGPLEEIRQLQSKLTITSAAWKARPPESAAATHC